MSHRNDTSPNSFTEGDERAAWAGLYIEHNATIGLRCFAFGLLAGIGGLYETVFNASTLGAVFGYMAHSPTRATSFISSPPTVPSS